MRAPGSCKSAVWSIKSTWLDVNTENLRDLNTWLAALIRLWISQVLEVALDLHPVGTHLDPGGGGRTHGRRGLVPLGGRGWGVTTTPIVLS